MTGWRRAGEIAALVLFVAMMGALVHLIAILSVPIFATRDAFARLAPLGAANITIALERPSPTNRLIPYGDPAVASAFCRFDLGKGPLRITAHIERSGFASLSFHSKTGSVFYALTDKAALRGRLDAFVLTDKQLRVVAAKDNEDEPSQDLRIVSPTDEGFVLLRAFTEQPSLYAAAEEDAGSLVCASL